jgi:energy-coupling factor transporter ATP-binding protein EcfA2
MLKIEIAGEGSARYKSIDALTWDNIPPFAVLTGLNGSGKTQLLELLAYRITETQHHQYADLPQTKIAITGDTFGPDSIAYLPSSGSFSGMASLGIGEMLGIKQQLYEQLRMRNITHNLPLKTKRARLEKLLGVQNLEDLSQADFVNRLPDDLAFMLEDVDVIIGLVHVFLAYRVRFAEEREKKKPETQCPSEKFVNSDKAF